MRAQRAKEKEAEAAALKAATKPQKLTDLPPRPPPLEQEKDLRKYIERK